MKVDFNRLKTEISLPDFLLNLGWKFVAGSSNSCPKMSNGTHTIVIKRNAQNQYQRQCKRQNDSRHDAGTSV